MLRVLIDPRLQPPLSPESFDWVTTSRENLGDELGTWEQKVLPLQMALVDALLAGPYLGGGQMRDQLPVPLASPYAADPQAVAALPADVTDWVPPIVAKALHEKLRPSA